MNITFTGVDIKTDIDQLQFNQEYAVLFTETPEGRNRYPNRDDVRKILMKLYRHHTALHVCGRAATQNLEDGKLDDLVHLVQRVQINGKVSGQRLQTVCERYPAHTIITQYNDNNKNLLDLCIENHAVLIDSSAGRGLTPDTWGKLITEKPVGFAGGLGLDNIFIEFLDIYKLAEAGAWIDMESKLRDENDWFSVDTVNDIIKTVNELISALN